MSILDVRIVDLLENQLSAYVSVYQSLLDFCQKPGFARVETDGKGLKLCEMNYLNRFIPLVSCPPWGRQHKPGKSRVNKRLLRGCAV
jgi:hypothetical protein